MMKILVIGPFPKPITGMSIANQMLYDGLKKNGNTVDYLDSDTAKTLGAHKTQGRLDIKKVIDGIMLIIKGGNKILFSNYNIVYITPAQSYLGFLKYVPFINCGKFKKIPVIIHFHGGFVKKMYDSLDEGKQHNIKKAFNKCDGIIVLGNSLKYMLKGIVPDEKIIVCENGVLDEFVLSRDEFNEKLTKFQGNGKIKILYLSNLMRTKGIMELLDACLVMKEKNEDFHLDLAGDIEADIRDMVNDKINLLGENVTYHGIVTGNDKKKLLAEANIFCLPTFYPNEGQPISILEAMTMGAAIVTCDQGGIRDIVENDVNGLICKPEVNEIYNAIINANNNCCKYMEYNYNNSTEYYSHKGFVNRVYNIFEKYTK